MAKAIIKYIRLVTGDEIIAEAIVNIETVTLKNPMVIEYMEMKTGANHPFMTRFDPYAEDHRITVDKRQIIFISDTTPEMKGYYKTSLKYAEDTCDKLVSDRVIEADQYIVDADTPASPVTTQPVFEDSEFDFSSLPMNLTFH